MYKVIDMEDCLFGYNSDLSLVLDAYLKKNGNNNKAPLWINGFKNSYAIIDNKGVVVACFYAKKGEVKEITIADNLKEPVSHLIIQKVQQVFIQEEDKEVCELIEESNRLCEEIHKGCQELDNIIERMKGELSCIK